MSLKEVQPLILLTTHLSFSLTTSLATGSLLPITITMSFLPMVALAINILAAWYTRRSSYWTLASLPWLTNTLSRSRTNTATQNEEFLGVWTGAASPVVAALSLRPSRSDASLVLVGRTLLSVQSSSCLASLVPRFIGGTAETDRERRRQPGTTGTVLLLIIRIGMISTRFLPSGHASCLIAVQTLRNFFSLLPTMVDKVRSVFQAAKVTNGLRTTRPLFNAPVFP